MHSPLPWKLIESVDLDNRIRDATDYWICDVGYSHNETDTANAAFIVRACNSHADLLEALKRLIEADDSIPFDVWSEEARYHNLKSAFTHARKAIEKAGG